MKAGWPVNFNVSTHTKSAYNCHRQHYCNTVTVQYCHLEFVKTSLSRYKTWFIMTNNFSVCCDSDFESQPWFSLGEKIVHIIIRTQIWKLVLKKLLCPPPFSSLHKERYTRFKTWRRCNFLFPYGILVVWKLIVPQRTLFLELIIPTENVIFLLSQQFLARRRFQTFPITRRGCLILLSLMWQR